MPFRLLAPLNRKARERERERRDQSMKGEKGEGQKERKDRKRGRETPRGEIEQRLTIKKGKERER